MTFQLFPFKFLPVQDQIQNVNKSFLGNNSSLKLGSLSSLDSGPTQSLPSPFRPKPSFPEKDDWYAINNPGKIIPGKFGSANPYLHKLGWSQAQDSNNNNNNSATPSVGVGSNPVSSLISKDDDTPPSNNNNSGSDNSQDTNPVGGLLRTVVSQLGKPEITNPLGALLGPLLGHTVSSISDAISKPIMEQKRLDQQKAIYDNENKIAQSHGYISAASMNGTHGPLTGNPMVTRASGGLM